MSLKSEKLFVSLSLDEAKSKLSITLKKFTELEFWQTPDTTKSIKTNLIHIDEERVQFNGDELESFNSSHIFLKTTFKMNELDYVLVLKFTEIERILTIESMYRYEKRIDDRIIVFPQYKVNIDVLDNQHNEEQNVVSIQKNNQEELDFFLNYLDDSELKQDLLRVLDIGEYGLSFMTKKMSNQFFADQDDIKLELTFEGEKIGKFEGLVVYSREIEDPRLKGVTINKVGIKLTAQKIDLVSIFGSEKIKKREMQTIRGMFEKYVLNAS